MKNSSFELGETVNKLTSTIQNNETKKAGTKPEPGVPILKLY